MNKYFVYKAKQKVKHLLRTIDQKIIGNFLLKHGLKEIQYSPILDITKYPPQNDIKIFTPYKTSGIFLEIGTGNGEHLVRLAKDNTDHTVIGFEITKEYVQKTAHRIMKEVCKNAKIVHGEARQLIEKYIPDKSVDKTYIICPDPWPKRRHIKHRITYFENFIPILKKLNTEGELILITDNVILAETLNQAVDHINEHKSFDIFVKSKKYSQLPKYVYRTKYIRKWEKQGSSFWYYSITIN